MRYILYFCTVLLFTLISNSFAGDITKVDGSGTLKNSDYNSVEVNGSLKFSDVKIEDYFLVNGVAKGENVKCKSLEVNGQLDVNGLTTEKIKVNGSFKGKNIEIKGPSEFNGALKIKNGNLNDIKVSGTKSTLENTKVTGNIIVQNPSSNYTLELKGNSSVSGDLIFQEKGKVCLFGDSKLEGKIVNADIIKKH